MKIYIVHGTHPITPGDPAMAFIDKAQADERAAELLRCIADDVTAAGTADIGFEATRPMDPITAGNWEDMLTVVQTHRYWLEDCSDWDEAEATMGALGSDEAAATSGVDVWIEQLELPGVTLPTPVPRVVVDITGGVVQKVTADCLVDVVTVDLGGDDTPRLIKRRDIGYGRSVWSVACV